MSADDKDLLQLPARAYVRVDEVAGFLGISTRHVRRLAEQGHFVTFRSGSTLRISRESVLQYVRRAVSQYQFESGCGIDDSLD